MPTGASDPAFPRAGSPTRPGRSTPFISGRVRPFHDGAASARWTCAPRSSARSTPVHASGRASGRSSRSRAPASSPPGPVRTVAGIRVPDDTTIVFTLVEPLNIFPKFMAMPVAAVVPTPTPPRFDQAPVGSGPWRFVSWSHDDAIVLARNPDYWAGPPKEDSLTVRIIPEALTQAAEFETGNLSVVEIPFGETRRWEMARPEDLQRRPALRDFYIAMNTTRGPAPRRARTPGAEPRAPMSRPSCARRWWARGPCRRRHPARHRWATTRPAPRTGGIPPGPAASWPRRATRKGFGSSSGAAKRAELVRVAQSVQQDLGLLGIQVEIVERDAPSVRADRAQRRGRPLPGRLVRRLPRPRELLVSALPLEQPGPGGNYAFLSRHARSTR